MVQSTKKGHSLATGFISHQVDERNVATQILKLDYRKSLGWAHAVSYCALSCAVSAQERPLKGQTGLSSLKQPVNETKRMKPLERSSDK